MHCGDGRAHVGLRVHFQKRVRRQKTRKSSAGEVLNAVYLDSFDRVHRSQFAMQNTSRSVSQTKADAAESRS